MVGLVESNKRRYCDELEMLEAYYRGSWFFEPNPSVPKEYTPPDGDVLVAYDDAGVAEGTVAICRMDASHCELKSMFVPEPRRGKGIAAALCLEAFGIARNLGYKTMRLTTGEKQPEAQALYRKLGFAVVAPWDDDPPAGFDYFEIDLTAGDENGS